METVPHDRFAPFLGNAKEVVVIIDGLGRLLAASASAEHLFGFRPEDNIGRSIVEFLHPDDLPVAIDLLSTAEEKAGLVQALEVRSVHADGHIIPVEVLPNNLLRTHGALVLTIRDITDKQRLERERRESEARFRAIAEAAPIAMFHALPDGTCLFANARWEEISGQPVEQALGFGWTECVSRPQRKVLLEAFAAEPDGGTATVTVLRAPRDERVVTFRWTAMRDESSGALQGFVGTVEDVTERIALEARLAHQATHDPLTGLPNRVVMLERLGQAAARAEATGTPLAVMFVDLDHFKVVNDSLGHDAGDRLIIAAARRIRGALRASDQFSRFGGDEFVVIAEGLRDAHEATEIAARIAHSLRDPFALGEPRPYHCSASIGIAASRPGCTPETLLREADAAMYLAKERGRNRAELFDERLRSRALDRLSLEADLRSAIERRELTVVYQPIVQALTGDVHAVEALVRWPHPERGLLGAGVFIPMAEENGFITEIGTLVLHRACTDLLHEDVLLNVNLSARQLADEELVGTVRNVLHRTGFPPHRLTFEITETALMGDTAASGRRLDRLRALGARIAVDDFGTGYSSLNYLSRFPIDSLKVDRSFVDGLRSGAAGSGDGEIVRAIISLAHSLGMTATAEGVERWEQLDELTALGCEFAQGYLFAPPVELGALGSALRSGYPTCPGLALAG